MFEILWIFLLVSVLMILMIITQWIIYTKAGQPGWACIVPIYNILILLKIVGKPWWWILLMLIPIVNIVIQVMIVYLLAKSFGKGVGFTIGLFLLSIVFYPILAFGDAKYLGPAGETA